MKNRTCDTRKQEGTHCWRTPLEIAFWLGSLIIKKRKKISLIMIRTPMVFGGNTIGDALKV